MPCFLDFFGRTGTKNYIAGSITSPPLSGLLKRDGFSDIPTHVCSQFTNASSSTSSDYHYAILGHDLMCSIAANQCNMIQHKKMITWSNTTVIGLYLRCKDGLNFIHSMNCRQMVKILCSYQEYFQWGIFRTLTCNTE